MLETVNCWSHSPSRYVFSNQAE